MNSYDRGFVDGLREAYRLMQANYEIDLAPGRILDRIKQLSGDEGTSLTPEQPDARTCHTDPSKPYEAATSFVVKSGGW